MIQPPGWGLAADMAVDRSTTSAIRFSDLGAPNRLCDAKPTEAVHTWGSIMSGQRRALLMMMALSRLRESLGRPSSSQLRIVTGSPSTVMSLKLVLHGMLAVLQAGGRRPKPSPHCDRS